MHDNPSCRLAGFVFAAILTLALVPTTADSVLPTHASADPTPTRRRLA